MRDDLLGKSYLTFLRKFCCCPICYNNLFVNSKEIKCKKCGANFKIIEGIPILINKKLKSTHIYYKKFEYKKNLFEKNKYGIFKHVENSVGSTCGYMYKKIKLNNYPIPDIDLNKILKKNILLDIGCGWGRWSFSANNKGYKAIGIDTDLKYLILARKINIQNKSNCIFIYADATNLPFKKNVFDVIFSYSVLQHFPRKFFFKTVTNTKRILKKNGLFKFQIMNNYGIRVMIHKIYTKNIEEKDFFPEFYSIKEMKNKFSSKFNSFKSENCSFFTQGRIEDIKYLNIKNKFILIISYLINSLANLIPFIKYVSDNIYIKLKK